MSNFKYHNLVKIAILCTGLFLNREALAGNSLNRERLLVGPEGFVAAKPPKPDWEGKKPQGSAYSGRVNSVDYFTKRHPKLLKQASKNLFSKNKSFVIRRNIDGNPEYDDPRY